MFHLALTEVPVSGWWESSLTVHTDQLVCSVDDLDPVPQHRGCAPHRAADAGATAAPTKIDPEPDIG